MSAPVFVADVYPERFQPSSISRVHAGREVYLLGEREIHSACRGWFVDTAYAGLLTPETAVTCKACLARMGKRLTISQVMAEKLRARPTGAE